jgi:hypothetical protein
LASLAALGTAITIGSAVVGAGASVISAYSTYQQGEAQKAELERQAGVDELAGKNEYAASQRQAEERRLEAKLVQSRQQAYAAASGGGAGADAPTIVKLFGDTERRGEYGAQTVMYQGEAARDDYYAAASAKRATGQNNFFGSILAAAGTLAGGVGKLGGDLAPHIPSAPGWRTIAG